MNLHRYITENATRKFRYGRHDCVTFVGRWAEHVTGRKLLPAYHSKAEAEALLADTPMLDRLRAEFVEINRLAVRNGDIALYPSDSDLPALGIVCNDRATVFTGQTIGPAPLSDALHFFRVQPWR